MMADEMVALTVESLVASRAVTMVVCWAEYSAELSAGSLVASTVATMVESKVAQWVETKARMKVGSTAEHLAENWVDYLAVMTAVWKAE